MYLYVCVDCLTINPTIEIKISNSLERKIYFGSQLLFEFARGTTCVEALLTLIGLSTHLLMARLVYITFRMNSFLPC